MSSDWRGNRFRNESEWIWLARNEFQSETFTRVVNSLATLFQLTPIKHKQLDRGVISEKNQLLLGLRSGSRKKLKDPWLHIYRSWIVKDYGDRSYHRGLSQDRCKSTSWSMVHPRIVEIYYYHRTSHRSLRLLAKSSDRGNSTKRRNLLVKLERPPKRSLGFSKLRS